MSLVTTAHDGTRSFGTKITSTGVTAVYTAPSTIICAKGVSLRLCNVDGTNSVDLTVEWYDISAADSYKIASTYQLGPDVFLDVDFGAITLDPGDEARVTASAANDVHVVCTVTEIFGR